MNIVKIHITVINNKYQSQMNYKSLFIKTYYLYMLYQISLYL